MQTKKVFIVIILVLIAQSSFGQQFTNLNGDYLGQSPPGDTPAIFAPGIVSTAALEHSAPTFNPDGNEIYWSVIRNERDTVFQDIQYVKRIGNRWIKPQTAQFSGNYYDGGPLISADGNKLYYYRDQPVPPGKDAENICVWCRTRAGDHWVNPVNVGGGFSPSCTKSGTMYFGGPTGIFRMIYRKGKYSEPEFLNDRINMPGYMNWTPFIAPDESYLIFSRHINNGDLFITFHDTVTDTWTTPVDMGSKINTPGQERFPSVCPDGKYMFFTRSDGNNRHDVYWVSAKVIDDIKKVALHPKDTK